MYTPAYDPDSNRIEWLRRALHKAVTNCHTRQTLPELLEDADAWARDITPTAILRQISSPCADGFLDPHDHEPFAHAA